jgi:polysaccharide export outer membrane protein
MRFVGQNGTRSVALPRTTWAACVAASLFATVSCGGGGSYVWYSDLPKSEWGPTTSAPTADYIIGVGDVVSVRVYEQEGVATTSKVRTDGRISMTLIGEVVAAGKRPTMLARELETRLKEFIVSPRVTVNVDTSQPVSIVMVGEFAHGGALTLEPPANLLQATALAGGPNDFADRSRILVIRRFPEFRRIRFTYDALLENQGGAAGFPLRTGDIVVAE